MAKFKWTKFLDVVAFILVTIGALSWGLIGAFHINLLMNLFGMNLFLDIIYTLVGLSGIYSLFRIPSMVKKH